MQIKFNKEQKKILKKHHKLLTRLSRGGFVGAITSKKRNELGDVYDQVADNRCSSCNNKWIKRLAVWYIME